MRTAYTDAVESLAQDFLHRQFAEAITTNDAREYVDAHVIADWIGTEAANRGLEIILGDLCAERVSGDDARAALVAIAIGNEPRLMAVLRAALIDQIERDLACEAQQCVDNWEPTDSEIDRGGDALASEARSFARRHNASIAAWRVLP